MEIRGGTLVNEVMNIGFHKRMEICDQKSECWLLKKDSALWGLVDLRGHKNRKELQSSTAVSARRSDFLKRVHMNSIYEELR